MLGGKELYSLFEVSQSKTLPAWEHLTQAEQAAWEETALRIHEFLNTD